MLGSMETPVNARFGWYCRSALGLMLVSGVFVAEEEVTVSRLPQNAPVDPSSHALILQDTQDQVMRGCVAVNGPFVDE